jgi:hypothetical protein
MANIAITAANVAKGSQGQVLKGVTAGQAITAGQVVYLNTTDSKYYLAESDDTAAKANIAGIALNSAPGANQPISICTLDNDFTVGGTVVAGTAYYLSTTAGSICLASDLANPNYVTLVGIGISATKIKLNPVVSGVIIPA